MTYESRVPVNTDAEFFFDTTDGDGDSVALFISRGDTILGVHDDIIDAYAEVGLDRDDFAIGKALFHALGRHLLTYAENVDGLLSDLIDSYVDAAK